MSTFWGVLVLILLAEETAAKKQYIWCVEYESNRTGRVGVARYGVVRTATMVMAVGTGTVIVNLWA